jgi:hypothetical protein
MVRKIIFWTLIVLTVFIVLLLILLPGIAKKYAVNHSKELVGRQIALDKLKINYFTGKVTVTDFKMFEADDKEVFVSFDTLLIDAEPYRYILSDLVIEQFYLKGLKTKIIQKDSIFNFDDLVTFFTTPEDSVPKDTTVSEPLQFQISNIELKGAEFKYHNQVVNKTTTLNDVSFFIPYIGWDQKEKSKAGLRFAFKNEGYFESSVNFDPVGGDFEANLTVYHLYLEAFKDYVATSANINSFEGMMNSNFAISGNINEPDKAVVSGQMEVLDFLMTDKQDKKFLGAKRLGCNLKLIDYFNSGYIIDSLVFSEPYVYFRMEGESNNFIEIFNLTDEAEDSKQPVKVEVKPDTVTVTPLNYSINNLIVENGIFEVENYENVKLIRGALNSHFVVTGDMNEPDKSIVTGSAEMLDFLMKDKQDKKFLGAKKLECSFKTIDYFNSSYIIDSLVFSEPYVYFRMDSLTNNFFEAFNISTEEDSAQVAEVKTGSEVTDPLYYAINHMIVNKGVVEYADNLTGEIFDYYLSDIKMNADKILSTSDWVKINSKMLLNKRGSLVAEVGFNPMNPYDIILDYTIKDFQLSDLNIYSKYYMGFPIVYGDMYYKSHTEILKNQLTSENKLIIQNAELGDKRGGLYDLPMKFALFILKDKNGIINLDIPVRGDLNDPTVSVGKIVWTTFKNLIVKVGTAPVSFLAGLISVDPKDIKAIEYSYLDTTFTSARQKQLDKLLELEKKKDGLKIELVYFNDSKIEKQQIAVSEAGKIFTTTTGKNYQSNEKEFNDFLKEKTLTDSLKIEEASFKLVPATVVDSLYLVFEQARKNSIEKYLHTVNDSTQIRFIGYDSKSPKNMGSIPQFETKYSLTDEKLEKQ